MNRLKKEWGGINMKVKVDEWQKDFGSIADNISNDLLDEAKDKSKTYREASAYIKKVAQQAYGDITDPVERAARTINGAICDLSLYKLHEEERDLPIKKEIYQALKDGLTVDGAHLKANRSTRIK